MLKRSQGIYTMETVFKPDFFCEILDEFQPKYNSWIFDKKEVYHLAANETNLQTSVYPAWGSLYKYDDFSGKNGIGNNLKFIKASFIVQTYAEKTLGRKLKLERINTNIQFPGQESTFHCDGSSDEWTFLVFIHYFWKTEWGGEFICQTDEQSYIGIPYLPNNGVLFRADLEHRGSAPNNLCVTERKSLAFTFGLE
jgi:hypothetical protein